MMKLTDNPSVVMKFLSRHKILFGSLIVVWVVGMICTVTLMGRNGHTKIWLRKTHPVPLPHHHNDLPPPNSYKMVKALRYCNLPEDISLGQEGKMAENYTLELVATVIRHGDRSPLRQIRNQTVINCGIPSQLNHTLLNKYLTNLRSVQRHLSNDDSFSVFPLIPHLKLCSPSHLTLLGSVQHLWLGNMLGKIYNNYWKLLSKDSTANNIKIYSTKYPRTFQSAVAFLYGFLPKFNFSQIEIIPSTSTRFCLSDQLCNCPLLEYQQKMIEKKQKKLLGSHPAVLHLLQQLNPIVKLTPAQSDVTSATGMFDILMGYVCHNSPLPCIPNTHTCVTIDHVRNLMAFLDWERKQLAGDGIHKRNALLKMHGLLVNIHRHMQDLISGKSTEKFILYSGHDITLSPLASYLGFNDGVIPSYASRIIFELYTSVTSKKHKLRVLYNGKDVTKYLPFCRNPKQNPRKPKFDVICSFDKFTKFVQRDFLKIVNASSYEAACGFPLTTPGM